VKAGGACFQRATLGPHSPPNPLLSLLLYHRHLCSLPVHAAPTSRCSRRAAQLPAMSKPSLRAVLPRSHVRAHARTLYTSPFTSLHHAHLDAGLLSSMPTGRGSTVTAPTPRLSTAGGVGSSSSSTGAGQSQPDGLSQLYDISTFQPNSHSSSTSGQPTLGSPSLQVVHHPPPPATPPLQNSAPAQSGARLFPGPLPLASSSLPASLAALPPMSHYQQILATIPSNMAAPESTKRTRAAFALESAAYGIPKHRSRGMSSGPVATSSFATSSARGFDTAAASSDTDANLAVQVGEDAYFLLPSALGVSDGVGGWSQKGRSQGQPQGQSQSSSHTGPSASAQFSRRLMHFCAEEISALGPLPDAWPTPSLASSSSGTSPSSPVTLPAQAGVLNQASAANMAGPDPQSSDLLEPVAVLERAYTRALALSRADHSLCGSSTAMLAILLGDELRVAHLGDCAVCLVRNGQMVFRSEEQQWKVRFPCGGTDASTGHVMLTIPRPVQSSVTARAVLIDGAWRCPTDHAQSPAG